MVNKADPAQMKKICESCRAEFGCGAKLDGCWCTKLELAEPQAAQIKAKFGDCLCPKCLEKFAEAKG